MSLSPRPASAPSGDSRRLDKTSSGTSYFQTAEQRSSAHGEPSESHDIPISVTPTPPSDGHRTTTQGTRSNVVQSEGYTNGQLGNAATFHTSSSIAESDSWTRKTLLTLDGGGVRGYSSLLILRALMIQVAELEQKEPQADCSVSPLEPRAIRRATTAMPNTTGKSRLRATRTPESQVCSRFLPCHYFDFIAGTSTGGLIAIMLGRLSMTVNECIEAYEDLADRVFGHPRHFHIRRPPWVPRDKYDHRLLEGIIKEIVKKNTGSVETLFQQPNEDMCRTIVIAWQKISVKGTRVPYLMRSYRHPKSLRPEPLERNPDSGTNHWVWKVARATSAAPLYFKAVDLEEGDEKSELIDGGFGANNPSEEAYRSVKQLCSNNPKAVSVLISIGTGKNLEHGGNPKGGYKLYLKYANAAAKWATDSEKTHETISDMTSGNAKYFRLNVEHGIGKMKLDEWKGKKGRETLKLIHEKTEAYLKSEEAQASLTSSARHLVDIRRLRCYRSDPDRWERFCHGVEYACCHDGCPTSGNRYREKQELRSHLSKVHSITDDAKVQPLLEEGKCYPLHDET